MKSIAAGLILVLAALVLSAPASAQSKKNGAKVYKEYCSTCHQKDGKGLAKVYPPLYKSDYIKKKSKETLIREVVFGKSGKVKVNGKEYNGVMAPLPKKYSDKDVSDVMTYVFNMFGNKKGRVTVDDVKEGQEERQDQVSLDQ